MSKYRDALLRHWAMLRTIPREPRSIGTGEVQKKLAAEGYDVSLRTVQRDLQNLSTVFPFTCEEGSGPMGAIWYWPEKAETLDVPNLSPAEALVLTMARGQLDPMLPADTLGLLAPQFRRAEQILSEQSGNRLASWKRRIRVLSRGPKLVVPAVSREIQTVVYDGVLARRQIFARYHGRSAEEREFTLHPFGLVVKDGIIYLIATAWDYETPFHYALHRFTHAKLLDDPARVPRDFDLDAYIEHEKAFSYPRGEKNLSLALAVEESVGQHLAERPLSAGQRISRRDDGRLLVEAGVPDTAELRWWLLGFGSDVEVLEPASLRKEMLAMLSTAVGRYTAPAVDEPSTR